MAAADPLEDPGEASARTSSGVGSYESVARVVDGLGLPLEGLRMIFRERSLWPLAAVPFGLSLVAVTTAAALLYWNAGALYEFVAGWLPAVEAEAWYSWLWVAPARAGLWLAGSAAKRRRRRNFAERDNS